MHLTCSETLILPGLFLGPVDIPEGLFCKSASYTTARVNIQLTPASQVLLGRFWDAPRGEGITGVIWLFCDLRFGISAGLYCISAHRSNQRVESHLVSVKIAATPRGSRSIGRFVLYISMQYSSRE